MAIKEYNPTSPGRRGMTAVVNEGLSPNKPEKSLIRLSSSSGGRNNAGRITVRFRGGGHKRRYRVIDFKREKVGIPAKVASIEYDPNRTARIALLNYADGEKRYILAPHGLAVGDFVRAGSQSDVRVGNALPLMATIFNFLLITLVKICGLDGTRTRDPLRDRQVF